MTKQFSVTLRNAWLTTYETTIGPSPIMRIRTGSQPSSCAAAATGTVLWTETLPSDFMGAPSNGSSSKLGTWEAVVAAAGTAGWYEIVSAGSPSERHEQGSITRAFSLTTNGATAANNNVLNFSDTTGVSTGMAVAATGIPSGATVLAVGATTVTMSAASTTGVSNGASVFFGDLTGDMWLADTALEIGEGLVISVFTRTAPGA